MKPASSSWSPVLGHRTGDAGAKPETRLYDAPHELNAGMPDDAFGWLDRQLKPGK